MFGTRKTWDLGDAPCLQDLWKKDLSLDGESLFSLLCRSHSLMRGGRAQQEPVWPHFWSGIVTDKEELEEELEAERWWGRVCVSHAAGLRGRGVEW